MNYYSAELNNLDEEFATLDLFCPLDSNSYY